MAPAASWSFTPCGTGTSVAADAVTYSAYDPSVPLHATRSPTFTDLASEPTAVTTPAPSCPGTKGSGVLKRPSRKYKSIEFTPAAATFTTASVAFGWGTGSSANSNTSGPPDRLTRIAFMLFVVITLVYQDSGYQQQLPCRLSSLQVAVRPLRFCQRIGEFYPQLELARGDHAEDGARARHQFLSRCDVIRQRWPRHIQRSFLRQRDQVKWRHCT